jgi:hypothetical protein
MDIAQIHHEIFAAIERAGQRGPASLQDSRLWIEQDTTNLFRSSHEPFQIASSFVRIAAHYAIAKACNPQF